MESESIANWTLGLLLLLIFLFIGFIIAVMIWVFLPIRRIEEKVNRTADDIEVTLGNLNKTSNDVAGVVDTVTETSNNVNELIDQVETFAPQIKTAVCGFLPHLSICT